MISFFEEVIKMRSSGLVFGLIIGLAIAAILIKAANKDGKFKTKYDERQEAVRGKAYKYSFYTLLFFEVLRIIPESGNLLTGISSFYISLFGILLGCFVLCVHSIWNGAYWGLNNNKRTYFIIFIFATIINALPVIGCLSSGGKISFNEDLSPMINVMVIVWLALIGVVALIKKMITPKEENGEG